jgi:hypothetical protein
VGQSDIVKPLLRKGESIEYISPRNKMEEIQSQVKIKNLELKTDNVLQIVRDSSTPPQPPRLSHRSSTRLVLAKFTHKQITIPNDAEQKSGETEVKQDIDESKSGVETSSLPSYSSESKLRDSISENASGEVLVESRGEVLHIPIISKQENIITDTEERHKHGAKESESVDHSLQETLPQTRKNADGNVPENSVHLTKAPSPKITGKVLIKRDVSRDSEVDSEVSDEEVDSTPTPAVSSRPSFQRPPEKERQISSQIPLETQMIKETQSLARPANNRQGQQTRSIRWAPDDKLVIETRAKTQYTFSESQVKWKRRKEFLLACFRREQNEEY